MRRARAQIPGGEREMVVLDEHGLERIRELLDDRISEAMVHRLVRRPVLGSKDRLDVRHVAERPQALVREAAVYRASS